MTDNTRASATVAPNINVTPLIDILLVLLIIFMVITPLRPSRFKATVPAPPENEKEVISRRTLIVSVDDRLRLKLIRGDELVAEATIGDAGALASRLAREFAERRAMNVLNPELAARADLIADERVLRTVFVKAPRSIRYGEVARVIDAVKGAGASPVGLQTDELPD